MNKLFICMMFFLSACANTNALLSENKVELNSVEKGLIEESSVSNRMKARDLLLSADQAYVEKRWVRAKKLYAEAEALGAQDKKTLLRLGNLSIITRDLENAQKYFITLLTIDPNNSKAQYNLATVYLAQAEDHFQYYIATLNDKTVDRKLYSLLNSIEDFSRVKKMTEQQPTPLDSLRKLLENQ